MVGRLFLGRPRGRMVNSKRESSNRAFIARPASLGAAAFHAAADCGQLRLALWRIDTFHPAGLTRERPRGKDGLVVGRAVPPAVLAAPGPLLGATHEVRAQGVPHALPTGQRPAARAHLHAARPQLSRLTAQHPEGLSSQRQALKALAAIVQTDEPAPDAASSAARSQSAVASSAACCQSAVASSAARGQSAVASPAARGQSAVASPAARSQSAVASPAARSQSAVASSAARCQSAVAGSAARCQSAVAGSAARRKCGPQARAHRSRVAGLGAVRPRGPAPGPTAANIAGWRRPAPRWRTSWRPRTRWSRRAICANKGAGCAGCGRISRGRSTRRSAIYALSRGTCPPAASMRRACRIGRRRRSCAAWCLRSRPPRRGVCHRNKN